MCMLSIYIYIYSAVARCSAAGQVALERLGSFISSLGLYGRGTSMPLLYPMPPGLGKTVLQAEEDRRSTFHRS